MWAVLDADNCEVFSAPPFGHGVVAARFDPDSGFAYASCGEGVLTVVHEDSPEKFSVVQNVKTAAGARTMAMDTKTHNLFLVTAKFGPRPAPTADNPHARPPILPGSFEVLVVGK